MIIVKTAINKHKKTILDREEGCITAGDGNIATMNNKCPIHSHSGQCQMLFYYGPEAYNCTSCASYVVSIFIRLESYIYRYPLPCLRMVSCTSYIHVSCEDWLVIAL